MIKDYCKATITWKPKINNGYGTTFGTSVTVNNVYFEPNIKLVRGQDNTSNSKTMFITYDNTAFKLGDYIEHSGRVYHVTAVSEYYKPRTAIFDHLEVDLTEVQNG